MANTNAISGQFIAIWDEFKKQFANFDISNITDINTIQTYDLTQKAIAFIDSYLLIADQDLNDAIFTNCLNMIKGPAPNQTLIAITTNLINQKNITFLSQVKEKLLQLMNHVKGLVVIFDPRFAESGVENIIKSYVDTITKVLEKIDFSTVQKKSEEIKLLNDKLLNPTDGLDIKVNNTYKNITAHYNEINKLYQTLYTDNPDGTLSINTKISSIVDKINKAESHYSELEQYYSQVFEASGLKDEVSTMLTDLKSFKVDSERLYEEKSKLIDELLNGATNITLSRSFSGEREKFDKPMQYWSSLFFVCLISIPCIYFYEIVKLPPPNLNYNTLLQHFIYNLPIFAPITWLAIFASKRRGENKRLQQEYIHKETVSKSYLAFKEQIEKLNQESQELMLKLMDRTIDVIVYNASFSLDKKHDDHMPIIELTKELGDAAEKIKGIKK